MLNVTEPAAAHLANALSSAPEENAVRFVVQGNGQIASVLDSPREEDAKFEHDDRTVLVLDQQMSQLLGDKTLELKETEQGAQLVLH
jgi:Fe-S cluster assembly iron-binding protein IscA